MLITSCKKLLFLFISFYCFFLQSQTKEIDSLKNLLNQHIKKDTLKVNLYNDIASYYYFKKINIDSLAYYATIAYNLSEEKKYIKGKAKSLYLNSLVDLNKNNLNEALHKTKKSISLLDETNNSVTSHLYETLGKIHTRRGDTAKALTNFNIGIKNAIKHKKKLSEASFYNNIGKIYAANINDYDKGILYYQKSLNIYDSLKAFNKATKPLNNIAVIYQQQGRYLEALEITQKCLDINKKLNNKNETAINLLNIGTIYSELHQIVKSIKSTKESLEIFKELGKKKETSYCFINIGNLYMEEKNYQKALINFEKALLISNTLNNKKGLYYCYYNLGYLNYILNNYPVALRNYKKAIKIVDFLKNDYLKCELYLALSEFLYHKKETEEGIDFCLKAKQIAYKLSLIREQKESHELLSKLYHIKGNYKEAYKNHLQFKTLSDSLFNEETIEKITQLEHDYKYKKERDSASKRELKLTQKVKVTTKNLEKSQKNLFLGIIIFLITSILLLAGLFSFKIRHIKAKNENILTEQKLLRSQMTPHFIFNSLAVLQGIILNKEEKKSVSYLSKFSKLLRIILENSRDNIVLLSEELKAIENYLALQNIHNSENPYKYNVKIDSSINKQNYYIPPMLIQPFIENAIEHAFINKKENKEINVFLNLINNELICNVSDNGVGVNINKNINKKNKKSLATIITSERLSILSNKYNMKGHIKIEDRIKYNEKGTIVTITIPYKLKKND